MNTFSIGRISILTGAIFPIIAGCSSEKDSETRPNIIMFMVDDMGWQDTSVPFWKEKTPFNMRYNTPAMERLAGEGMTFTQAYASSVSSPTRVSLITGMNAARHRVTNWTLRRDTAVDGHSDILSYPHWNVNGVQPCDTIPRSVRATMLPQILRENGYYTIHCGKAHFGAMTTPAANPLNCGFDVNIAGHAAGGPGSYLGTENFGNAEKGVHTLPWGVPGLEKFHGDSIFLTEALTREAIKALTSSKASGKPFYLYMAHYAVHIPLYADMRFYQKYIDADLGDYEARYASMVEGMDKSLGDLMDYLDNNNLADNTIILFMSDNGGFSLRPREGELHTHNKPLNSGKGSAYEGGIREPMIVKWPGKVKPGTKCNDYLLIEDFFPTILEMAEVKEYKTVQKIDGKSFVPMLVQSGTTSSGRDLFWHYPNNWGPTGPGIGTTSTIRSGDWKLIYFYEDKHFELYNIEEDIGELNNQSGNHPGKVKELAVRLGTYLRSVDAQRPSFKTTGKIAEWPDEAISGVEKGVPPQSSEVLNQSELLKQFAGDWEISLGKDTALFISVKSFRNGEGFNVSDKLLANGKILVEGTGFWAYDDAMKKINLSLLRSNGEVIQNLGTFTSASTYEYANINNSPSYSGVTKCLFEFISPDEIKGKFIFNGQEFIQIMKRVNR